MMLFFTHMMFIDSHPLFTQHQSPVLHSVQMNDDDFVPCFKHELIRIRSELTPLDRDIRY